MKQPIQRREHRDRFLAFYDASFQEAYRYAARLCGSDREAAEDLVQDAYMAILQQMIKTQQDALRSRHP